MRRKFLKWKTHAHGDQILKKFAVKESILKFELILHKLGKNMKKNKKASSLIAWRRWEREVELIRQERSMVQEEREAKIAEQENEKRRVELETRRQKRQ